MTRHIELLRDAVRAVRRTYPFDIHGWVVLPDRLHCAIQDIRRNTLRYCALRELVAHEAHVGRNSAAYCAVCTGHVKPVKHGLVM